MSGNENETRSEFGQAPAAATATAAAVVGLGGRGELVAEILRSHGWTAAAYELSEQIVGDRDLNERDLVVITGMRLTAVGRELKLIGPAGQRPAAIAVVESIRPGEVRQALAAGLAGVVLAGSLTATLMPCVEAVLVGLVAVPRLQARQVEAGALSTREKQILGLVVMSCSNSEIAERLVVAESTVKSHLSSAFGKLGVRSRNEAVDLILDSERGLGMGILGLSGEAIETGDGAAPAERSEWRRP